MKKIANDDDRLKEQKKLEVVDCGLSSVERAAAGWSCGESRDYGDWSSSIRAGLLACWEKMIERNKNNFFYLLYIIGIIYG